MKTYLAAFVLSLAAVGLALPAAVRAEDEKIDPTTYICAEYVALASTQSAPPLFQSLQIDGFVSSNIGKTVADPRMVMSLMARTYAVCQRDPTAVAADVWQEMKLELSDPQDEHWKADATTCRQYNDNPDDGSGFVIWLDGYNRHSNVTEKSVLDDQKTLDAFLAAYKKKPDARMIDVMQETLKNAK